MCMLKNIYIYISLNTLIICHLSTNLLVQTVWKIMVGEDITEITSSQESLPLSQETFEYVWNEFIRSSQPDDINVENIISDNGQQISNDAVKTEVMDICDTNIVVNQNELVAPHNQYHTERFQVAQIVQSSIAPVQPQISVTVPELQHVRSSLPASQTWPGEYDFTVSFNSQDKNTKAVPWTYSKIKDKLYVGKDTPCPINFSTNIGLPDAYVRVMALYTSPEQVSEVVHRCVNHSMEEQQKGIFEAEHLIRCESSSAFYEIDSTTGRHSVVVHFENPQAGQKFSTYIYKFTCFGSCSGGPNRRPLMLVFTLERGNQVIGRKKLDVKICACPGRDRKTEESQCIESEKTQRVVAKKRKLPNEFVNLSDVLSFTKSVYCPHSKKTELTPDKDGCYVITTRTKDCYDFLLHMKQFYEMCQSLGSHSQQIERALNVMRQQTENEKNP